MIERKFGVAFRLHIAAIPLAASVPAPAGIILSPVAEAVLMSLSTLVVAVNAMTRKMR